MLNSLNIKHIKKKGKYYIKTLKHNSSNTLIKQTYTLIFTYSLKK